MKSDRATEPLIVRTRKDQAKLTMSALVSRHALQRSLTGAIAGDKGIDISGLEANAKRLGAI